MTTLTGPTLSGGGAWVECRPRAGYADHIHSIAMIDLYCRGIPRRYPGEGNHKGCPYVVFLNCYRLSHFADGVPLFFGDGLNG